MNGQQRHRPEGNRAQSPRDPQGTDGKNRVAGRGRKARLPSADGEQEKSKSYAGEASLSRRCCHAATLYLKLANQQMSKPHARLHFAGEHTRRFEVGMEAAMESGERAALEVLQS